MLEMLLLCSAILSVFIGLRLLFRNNVSGILTYSLWLPTAAGLLLIPVVYFLTGAFSDFAAHTLGGVPVIYLVGLVWLAGATSLTTWLILTGWSLRKALRKDAKPVFCPESPVPVWISPDIATPCLFGLLRPAIYLTPDVAADEESCRHVLAHELTHLRHGDHIWAFLRRLCLVIYWFHPLVWLAAQMSRQDSELACDEGALKRLGEAQRLAYGRTIVDLAAAPKKEPLVCSERPCSEVPKAKVRKFFSAPGVLLLASVAILAGGLIFWMLHSQEEISRQEQSVESIALVAVPERSRYAAGQTLDTKGLKLKLNYSDGTTREITEGFTCTPALLETSGKQKITVTYDDRSTSFLVMVSDVKKTGVCGKALKWILTMENDLFIEGTGPMYKYQRYGAPWKDYTDRIQSVMLPEGLTSIGSYSFSDCKKLTRVQIPDSVTVIGEGAFCRCTGLIAVVIPEGVKTIREATFYGCTNLLTVQLPVGLTTIEYAAFEHCASLISVDIPDTVTKIGSSAFGTCNSLTQVVIPGSIVSVADQFEFCGELKSVTLSEGVQRVFLDGFWGCNKLKTLHIPASVKTLGMESIENVAQLQAIYVDPGNSVYASDAQGVVYTKDMQELVYYPRGRSGSYSIHAGCRKIGQNAFAYSKLLTEVFIPDSVKEIGKFAFSDCFKLGTLLIPETVTKVGNWAFGDCLALKKLIVCNPQCQIDPKIYCSLGNPEITTIYGYPDSTAWAYAQKYEYKFVAITEEMEQ